MDLLLWQQIQRVSTYEKRKALILCIAGLFGAAGLHRLYVGKWITGIIYFFSFGFFGVGTIFDVYHLLNNSFSDTDGLYLESAARKRWDSKYAKWRYVYWSIASGRYFIDATSIQKESNENEKYWECQYLIELNYFGRKKFTEIYRDAAQIEYIIRYVRFHKRGDSLYIMSHKSEMKDKNGITYFEIPSSGWELVERNSMDECIYQAMIS